MIESHEHGRHAFACEIRELVPGERIVMSWIFQGPEAEPDPHESRLTVTLREAAPGRTELTLIHDRLRPAAPEDREGVREGWTEALDKLASLYARQASADA